MEAYACEPDPGSESGVGWNWAKQAARHGHEVHVITLTGYQDTIRAELDRDPIPGLHFHYLALPAPLPWVRRRFGYLGAILYHYLWQIAAALKARRLHRANQFDIAHHVTRVNDWAPSGLAALPIPFIWGPIGGSTQLWPKQIEARLPDYAQRHETIRRWTMLLAKSLDPLRRLTGQRASVILTSTEDGLAGLKVGELPKARPVVHLGTAADFRQAAAEGPLDAPELRIVAGNRLVHWKGIELLIEGFATYRSKGKLPARLFVTGDGPYRPYLEALVREHGLEDAVEFVGEPATRADLIDLLSGSHLYAMPTLRDGPQIAIVDAMSMGLPVLCLDHGATREMVPVDGGFKIPVQNRRQVIDDIAAAIAMASGDLRSLKERGARTREYVREIYNWDRIGDEIDRLYRELAAQPSS